ncbi:MAG: TPM domain-containing protein [Lachnospiraceae bacterium]|nr:TPM domain-containing protein [Lachnospiraceae bacterium]
MKETIIKYIKHFAGLFTALFIVVALYIFFTVSQNAKGKINYYESTNTERITTERVFDYADVLTAKQEAKLRKLIAKREKQTQCDIVIVTLNQSLADYEVEYRNNYPTEITAYEYVEVYADKFWEDYKFGYDKPLNLTTGLPDSGDGIILVDNIYEEYIPPEDRDYYATKETAKCTWVATQGKVEIKYSDAMWDHLLDVFYEKIDKSPYIAYKDFVNTFSHDMLGNNMFALEHHTKVPFIVVLIALLAYIPPRLKSKKGTVTTKANTYLTESGVEFPVREDAFLRKDVVRTVHVESSSGGGRSGGGGGGGHHSSGGGGSHGGGGHHR